MNEMTIFLGTYYLPIRRVIGGRKVRILMPSTITVIKWPRTGDMRQMVDDLENARERR